MTVEQPTPTAVSRTEFIQIVAQSGLLGPEDVPSEWGPSVTVDAAALAAELVAAGKLTRYQADAMLGRRPGDLRMGNYEILDRLGAGGMGTVFKARHRRMKRVVALKVLSKEVSQTPTFAHRFQREVETVARLTHPNIVMAFDADEGEAGPFLVMEFVNGRDLASEVTSGGPLPVADAVDRILQAARGLEYAHGQGIIHRDIKPGNLLRDADGVVKVADLGLARITGPAAGGGTSLTQAGSIFGTVDYMSPEQAVDSAAVDQRADVYSLGCTLYFLLTGHAPYQGGSLMSVMLKHRDAPVPSLAAERPDVTPELDAIFARMVAKQPDDRYPSMADAVRVLDQLRTRIPSAAVAAANRPPATAQAAGATDQTVAFGSPAAAADRDTSAFEVGPEATIHGAGVGASSLAHLTVVVAEPSRTQAGIIRGYLKQLGIESTHATGSGRETIDTVKRIGARIVISSLHLSDMTGVQLALALRADAACRDIGFVLATSETSSELMAQFPQDSRTAVMPKPFDLDRLSRSIASVAS
jgi:serine/threonine-protein kinase